MRAKRTSHIRQKIKATTAKAKPIVPQQVKKIARAMQNREKSTEKNLCQK